MTATMRQVEGKEIVEGVKGSEFTPEKLTRTHVCNMQLHFHVPVT